MAHFSPSPKATLGLGADIIGGSSAGQTIGPLIGIFKLIFSWVILTPISVIISGKLLAKILKLPTSSRQIFRVSFGEVITVEAANSEVILGFTGFILTLFLVGLVGGTAAYDFFRSHFGVDSGQFTSLCTLSSFLLVSWASLATIIKTLGSARSNKTRALESRHSELLETYAKENKGRD